MLFMMKMNPIDFEGQGSRSWANVECLETIRFMLLLLLIIDAWLINKVIILMHSVFVEQWSMRIQRFRVNVIQFCDTDEKYIF